MMYELQIGRELFEVCIIAPYFYTFLTPSCRGIRCVVMWKLQIDGKNGFESYQLLLF